MPKFTCRKQVLATTDRTSLQPTFLTTVLYFAFVYFLAFYQYIYVIKDCNLGETKMKIPLICMMTQSNLPCDDRPLYYCQGHGNLVVKTI